MKLETQHTKIYGCCKIRGKFTAINVHIKRKERLRINDLSFYFKKLRKEEQTKLKESKIKDTIEMSR